MKDQTNINWKKVSKDNIHFIERIEQKRKEFEDEVIKLIKEPIREFAQKEKVKGFNIGVEIAKKEFIDLLEFISRDLKRYEDGQHKILRNIINDKIKELKGGAE